MDDRNSVHEDGHISSEAASRALVGGPRGAFILSFVAAGLLFVGWLLFYFLIFMRRGYVG